MKPDAGHTNAKTNASNAQRMLFRTVLTGGRTPHIRQTANKDAKAVAYATDAVTIDAPSPPSRGIRIRCPANARGTIGPVNLKVQAGLPKAVSIAFAISIMSIPSAAKINKARSGPAGKNSFPKIKQTISDAAPAVIAAIGTNQRTERMTVTPISLAPRSSPLLNKALKVESKGGDRDPEIKESGMERFCAAP